MARSPVVILFDAAGNALAVSDGVARPANTRALLVGGVDASDVVRMLRLDANNVLQAGARITDGTSQAAVLNTPPGGASYGLVTRIAGFPEFRQLNADKIVAVNYRKGGISATTYYLLVDLDNAGGSGPYKHVGSSGIKMAGTHGTLLKSVLPAAWRSFLGTILTINGTQATIGWIRAGTIGAQDNNQLQHYTNVHTFPVLTDLTVVSGDYSKVADGFKEITTAVNTGITLEDVSGTARTPAVGDLIVRVEKVSGSGTILWHQTLWYMVD